MKRRMNKKSGMDLPDILTEIIAAKRSKVERLKTHVSLTRLEGQIESQSRPLNLAGSLMGGAVRVIAEVKKASPIKGTLRVDFDPVSLALSYANNGAAAISVITNSDHFQGDIRHLSFVQRAVNPLGIPVLQKEFIFDPYQVYESRAYGADAMLLIVGILTQTTLTKLIELAQRLWLQCLVEVHDEEELKIALGAGAEIIGINNRNLHSFQTDLTVSERLVPLIPSDKIIVSESGIRNREDIAFVGRLGVNAVLVGESLVTANDPGMKLREFV